MIGHYYSLERRENQPPWQYGSARTRRSMRIRRVRAAAAYEAASAAIGMSMCPRATTTLRLMT